MRAPDSLLDATIRGVDRQSSWTLNRLTGPNLEPVTVAEAKTHARIDTSTEDDYVTALIVAAREWVEWYTGCALIDQVWQVRYEGYTYGEFLLRRSPVLSVSSFVYDIDGVATTLASSTYELNGALTKWPRLLLASGQIWPMSYWAKPLTIQFRAGYADRAASPTEGAERVPAVFKHAIKMIVSFLYENREATPDLTPNVTWLLDPHCCNVGLA